MTNKQKQQQKWKHNMCASHIKFPSLKFCREIILKLTYWIRYRNNSRNQNYNEKSYKNWTCVHKNEIIISHYNRISYAKLNFTKLYYSLLFIAAVDKL